MHMIETIAKAWGWIGLKPVEVVASSAFGNVIVRDVVGAYWRICPEELSCELIAHSEEELQRLFAEEEFLTDWEMPALVELAREKLGPLAPDRCYCLKMPGVFGGEYVADNLGTNSRSEVIAFSGDVAEQIRDIPDGEG
jgi:hypothetical protein